VAYGWRISPGGVAALVAVGGVVVEGERPIVVVVVVVLLHLDGGRTRKRRLIWRTLWPKESLAFPVKGRE